MKETCFVCGGDGLMYFNESQLVVPCDNCGGTGEVDADERHSLEIWLNEYLYKHVESVSVSQMAFDIAEHIHGGK